MKYGLISKTPRREIFPKTRWGGGHRKFPVLGRGDKTVFPLVIIIWFSRHFQTFHFEKYMFFQIQGWKSILFFQTKRARKFRNLTFWNTPEWPNFTVFWDSHTFTMVEENFEIWLSETLQNGLILLNYFYVHHGRRKFWYLTFRNAPKWPNFTDFLIICSPRLKKI